MAEALLRDRVTPAVSVASAGLLYNGAEASGGSVAAMAKRDIDLNEHRSQIMTAEMLEAADLVLAMARVHVREAIVLDRSSFARTFTLKELVRRGEAIGPRGEDSFSDWLTRLGQDRQPSLLLGEDSADDVADPIGRSNRFYQRTATELSDLIDRTIDLAGLPRVQKADSK